MSSSPTIVVVGVGALGSHFILFSRNFNARFRVVDMDRVEQKNVLSQFHTRMGVRKNKAQGLGQAMQGLFGIRLDSKPFRLTEDNVQSLLGGADLVVDCLDNAESRRVIQSFVRAHDIPCVHGGLAANGTFGVVQWDQRFEPDEEAPGAATCEDGEHLPFIAMVSTALSQAVKDWLDNGVQKDMLCAPGSVRTIG